MNKKYAIFDMDGTLIDSMPVWENLAEEYLTIRGVKAIPNEVIEAIKPMTLEESSRYFINYFNLSGTPESLIKDMSTLMDNHYKNDIELKPKVKEYLDKLKSQGVVMCVASSTSTALMNSCLDRLKIKSYFEFILSSEEVGVGKNKPDVYFEAIRRLGSSIKDTIVYEDALFAINTAKQAGFYVVGVLDKCEDFDKVAQLANETINFY